MRTLLLNLCHYRGSTVGLFKKLVVMCFLAISLPVFADPIPDVEWIIKPNTPLIKGKAYHSQDRGAFLIFQRDGNLVLYKVISERTTNPPKSAVYQALWHSNTPIGKYVTKVIFQQDANLVVYNNSKALWNSRTSAKNRTRKWTDVFPPYSIDSWSYGKVGDAWMVIQDDNNLVIYTGTYPNPVRVLWDSQTAGR